MPTNRDGMTTLLTRLREMTNIDASSFSDTRMIEFLDANRLEVIRERLSVTPTVAGAYHDYYSRWGNYEEATTPNAFLIEDSTGTEQTDYTPNYARGHFRFGTDTGGAVMYLTGRSYDLYGAAADALYAFAAEKAGGYDVAEGGTTMKRSQHYEQIRALAKEYARKRRARVGKLKRIDLR